MTPTGRRGNARGLLRRIFVGRPPSKPPGRVNLALTLLGFPVWCSVMVLTWGAMPPLVTFAVLGMGLGGVLGTLGSLASYHRWRGERPGELLRVGSGLSGVGFVALLVAHIVQNGQWGWFWWTAFFLTLATVVSVAGHLYGPDDRPDSEGGTSAGRGPDN